ncbi:hypothetical protein C7120_08165 [Prevotella sp. oral taxon 376]|uniref:hypothetical protein n=1 Tax=Prevotella sp. oral taxon 376 TaxID=712466 RepID=UPI000D1F58D7|nr:hypothetical protein [Prevotella sp. oral taxon 376]PTL34476.1 hypothetical protein C7120_08165 [Prevotella sp. oral taxon 376]
MKQLKTLVYFFFLLIPNLASAAEDEFVRITSESQLTDSAVYLITCKDDTGYRNLKCQRYPNNRIDSILMFESTAAYASLPELKEHTLLFRMIRKDGHWLLRNTENERFVGEVNATVIQQQQYMNLFLHGKNADSKFFIGLEKNKKGTQILIGGKSLRYNMDAESFRLMAKGNTTMTYAELYCISGSKPAEALTLSQDRELGNQDFVGTVKFERVFESGYYNTLFLPFDVSHPQDAFGPGTTCYKPSSSTDSTVTFTKMGMNESLKANTPYLIHGTFSGAPYTFYNIDFRHQEADSVVETTLGPITIHGIYKLRKVGGSRAFILYQKGFYACTNLKSMTVEPYKWYLTCGQGNGSKLALLQIDGETLDIQGLRRDQPQGDLSVYTLQGIKTDGNWSRLPQGVYIQNGKKMVRR